MTMRERMSLRGNPSTLFRVSPTLRQGEERHGSVVTKRFVAPRIPRAFVLRIVLNWNTGTPDSLDEQLADSRDSDLRPCSGRAESCRLNLPRIDIEELPPGLKVFAFSDMEFFVDGNV